MTSSTTRITIQIAIAVLCLSESGCALTPSFSTGYEIPKSKLAEEPITGALAVRIFEEARPDRYYSSSGRMFRTYVPLIPYVTMPFERLEESVEIQGQDVARITGGRGGQYSRQIAPPFEEYSYPRSFPRAVATDLAATGLFERVDFIDNQVDDPEGHQAAGSDANAGEEDQSDETLPSEPLADYRYVLDGTLHESEYRSTATSFGLGAPGVLLWFLPIPMQKSSAKIDVELVLKDRVTNEVIWTKRVNESLRRYVTLYTGSAMTYGRSASWSLAVLPPPSDSKVDRRSLFSWHFEALRRGMLTARQEIAEALTEHLGADRAER